MFVFRYKFCVSLSAENTVFKLKWGGNLQNINAITSPSGPPTVFGRNQTRLPMLRIVHVLPNMQDFPNRWSMQTFFTSGICFDILMQVFEDCIHYIPYLGDLGFVELHWRCLLYLLPWSNCKKMQVSTRQLQEWQGCLLHWIFIIKTV